MDGVVFLFCLAVFVVWIGFVVVVVFGKDRRVMRVKSLPVPSQDVIFAARAEEGRKQMLEAMIVKSVFLRQQARIDALFFGTGARRLPVEAMRAAKGPCQCTKCQRHRQRVEAGIRRVHEELRTRARNN